VIGKSSCLVAQYRPRLVGAGTDSTPVTEEYLLSLYNQAGATTEACQQGGYPFFAIRHAGSEAQEKGLR
jgi:hypothetical protein